MTNATEEPVRGNPIPAAPAAREDAWRRKATLVFLLVATLVALYVCYLMFRPFLKSIVFAAVMAIIFYPLHARIQGRLRAPNKAALLSTLLVLLIVVVPAAGLGSAVTRELAQAYQWLSERSAAGGGWIPYVTREVQTPLGWLDRRVGLSRFNFRQELQQRVEELSASIVHSAADVLGNLTTFLFHAAISFFTLFFLFRDGRRIRLTLTAALPLERAQVERLFNTITDTVIANVYGALAVAGTQGFLTGLAFWLLHMSSPILWGLVATGCSLVPIVGTSIVWLPAALILAAGGHWVKGLVMLGCGGVVSAADHLIRPRVIGGRVRMNTLFVFFALLGGLQAFGILGVFIGPIVVSVTFALLDLLREEGRARQPKVTHEATSAANSPGAGPTGVPPQAQG